ncbi:MAG: TonB-dependent receptor [Desulfatitalea sp.]
MEAGRIGKVRLSPRVILKMLSLAVLWSACQASGPLWAHEGHGGGHGESAVQLEEVVVSASKIEEYIASHPHQVTVMTREQIDQGRYSDLDQVLNAMPGVEVKKSGGLGSRISIRGSGGGGKILVLINGRPVSGTQYGGVDLESIPLDMVARVDVFKPPVPVWLGPGGTEGAINILLADAAETSSKEKKPKTTRIAMEGGSFGKVGASASRQLAIEEHRLRLSAAGNHKDGRRANSDMDSGSLSFQWDLPAAEAVQYDLGGRYYQSEQGSAGPDYNPTPDARQSYQKGGLDFRLRGPRGESGDYNLKTYMDATRLEDRSQTGLVSTLDALTYGLKGETDWKGPDDQWGVRLSGGAAQDRIAHTLSGDHQREQASLGLQGDHDFDLFTATLGGRCDYTSDFDAQPAAEAGIGVPFGDRTLFKVNAGYAVNVPTFGQLYQPSHGAIDQVRGNPDLKEERVWSVSAGARHQWAEHRTVEITFFRTDLDDAIGYEEGADLILRPVNLEAGAYRQGVETVVDWRLNARAGLDMSYIYQQSRNRENDQELTYAPAHKLKVTARWTLPSQTRTETQFTAVSDQYGDLENSQAKVIDAYCTVDFKVIQPMHFTHGDWELFVYLENLLDEAFEVHAGYPDDGFRVTAGVNVDF